MKVQYFATLALASVLSFGTVSTVEANPCAGNPCAPANPCAGNPCAGNPCAGNPCAANPCAGNPCAGNPCAGNPCAPANPCAGNPCAPANPCAGNPCAGNPCAGNPCAAAASSASAPAVYTDPQAGNDLAIRGYDPVAYFTQGGPVEGTAEFEYDWNGATWRFSDARHMALFVADPEKYAPQYGGYCAKALSDGNLASIVPEAWKIVDGKLYLNYSMEAQEEWLVDTEAKIAAADDNWPEILDTAGVIYYDTVGAVQL